MAACSRPTALAVACVALAVTGCSVDVSSLQGQHDAGGAGDAAADSALPDVLVDAPGFDSQLDDAAPTDTDVADAEPQDADTGDLQASDTLAADALPDDAGAKCGDAATCDDQNDCTLDFCLSEACQHVALTNQACKGGDGWCYLGQCCEGCWDGANCRAGTTSRACGEKGQACTDCGADTSVCQPKVCVPSTASCTVQPATDGTDCHTECQNYYSQCKSGQCRLVDLSSQSCTQDWECTGIGGHCLSGHCRNDGADSCAQPFDKCMGTGTCDQSTGYHVCHGGCCDGQICSIP
jgi:hypothetical protein